MTCYKTIALAAALFAVSCAKQDDFNPETIISLERGALDRWGKGDPDGYLQLMADEITYFDPMREQRIDGIGQMRQILEPVRGKVNVSSYEMINPKVQRHGDIAILSFNLKSHAKDPTGAPVTVPWNSTEVYARINGEWKIVHNHWSITKPNLPIPAQ